MANRGGVPSSHARDAKVRAKIETPCGGSKPPFGCFWRSFHRLMGVLRPALGP